MHRENISNIERATPIRSSIRSIELMNFGQLKNFSQKRQTFSEKWLLSDIISDGTLYSIF